VKTKIYKQSQMRAAILLLFTFPPPAAPASSYTSTCSSVCASCFAEARTKMAEVQRAVDSGEEVAGFGALSETLCNTALENFSSRCPPPSDSSPSESAEYDNAITALEGMLDTSLQNIHMRLLRTHSNKALAMYKAETASTQGGSLAGADAAAKADEYFVEKSEEASRPSGDWSCAAERKSLQAHLSDLSSSSRKLTDVQLKAARDSQQAMQYLQMQQQQLQQAQMQLYGTSNPWNFGFAYRIPDSNVNLQGSYQQGRGNVQLSCVPDDYASMLGPNGFTNGVGPGNLGLSVNLSV